jgi:hypothetical protein
MPEIECRNCGKCCHVIENGKLKKCAMLKILPDGKTICRRYHGRMGFRISKNYKCGMRIDSQFNYRDCPYNSMNSTKPLFEDEMAKFGLKYPERKDI